eukprot:jgi/Mesvir1/13645/Mv02978-RA.1
MNPDRLRCWRWRPGFPQRRRVSGGTRRSVWAAASPRRGPSCPSVTRQPVSSSGDAPRARSRAALRRGGGLVVPAIFGVGAAIGTIQFGAGAFPNLFKGRDGKVDRNKVNLGGLAAGALVFLIARHVLS